MGAKDLCCFPDERLHEHCSVSVKAPLYMHHGRPFEGKDDSQKPSVKKS